MRIVLPENAETNMNARTLTNNIAGIYIVGVGKKHRTVTLRVEICKHNYVKCRRATTMLPYGP